MAARDRTTLKALVEEGLRTAIARREARAPYEFKMVTYGGDGTRPGVDLSDWKRVREILYEDRDA